MTTKLEPQLPPEIEGSNEHSDREQALALRGLMAIGAAYFVLQLVLFPYHRPPGWDESVYLSQVTRGMKAMFFMASRARGITLLVAPLTELGGSVGVVRLFLVAASAVTLTASFWLWIPLVGLAAPVAASVFAFSWLSLLNGSEVMPNFWAATLGLAVAGLVARRLEKGNIRALVAASVVLGAMAVFRPTEAAVVAGAIGAYVLLRKRTSWRVLVPLGFGLIVGWLPWIIEMSSRFGGPVTALREAGTAHFAAASVGRNVLGNLAFTDGRTTTSHLPTAGMLWWGLLIALAVVALARGRTATDRSVAVLCCIGTLALATEYLVFVSAQAPRFLLPAYAFASIPAGIGAVSLLRGRIVARSAGAIVLVLMVPWAIWQGAVGHRVQARETTSNAAYREIGLALRQLAGGRPCSFLSPYGYPEIQFAAECDGAALQRVRGPSDTELAGLLASGTEAFVVLPDPAPPASALGSLTAVRVPGPNKTWFVYQLSGLTG